MTGLGRSAATGRLAPFSNAAYQIADTMQVSLKVNFALVGFCEPANFRGKRGFVTCREVKWWCQSRYDFTQRSFSQENMPFQFLEIVRKLNQESTGKTLSKLWKPLSFGSTGSCVPWRYDASVIGSPINGAGGYQVAMKLSILMILHGWAPSLLAD